MTIKMIKNSIHFKILILMILQKKQKTKVWILLKEILSNKGYLQLQNPLKHKQHLNNKFNHNNLQNLLHSLLFNSNNKSNSQIRGQMIKIASKHLLIIMHLVIGVFQQVINKVQIFGAIKTLVMFLPSLP